LCVDGVDPVAGDFVIRVDLSQITLVGDAPFAVQFPDKEGTLR